MMRAAVLVSAMSLWVATGCGYHTAGHAVQLPQNVKTISIPTFDSQTKTYRIEQILTASVVREFTTRTHYRILNNPSDAADATLHGTVISTSASQVTIDSATGRAASALIAVSIKVSLSDRNGKVLYENPAYVFREQLQRDVQSVAGKRRGSGLNVLSRRLTISGKIFEMFYMRELS